MKHFATNSISWKEAQTRVIRAMPSKMTDEQVMRRTVGIIGTKRMIFNDIHGECMVSRDRLRDLLRRLCIAGLVKTDHRREPTVLRGGGRLHPQPVLFYLTGPAEGMVMP